MRKYWLIFREALQVGITYRGATVIRASKDVIITILSLFLWLALLKENKDIGGYTFTAIFTYYILIRVFEHLFNFSPADDLTQDIFSGNLTNFLVKPVKYVYFLGANSLGRRMARLSVTLIIFVILSIVLPQYLSLPSSLFNFILMILLGILSWLVCFQIACLIGLCGFWITETWTIRATIGQIIGILGGYWVPINLFPKLIVDIVSFTPFPYFYFFLSQIYQGKTTYALIVKGFAVQTFWFLLFLFILKFAWKKGVENYTAYGR